MIQREELPRPLPAPDTPCPVIDAYKKDVDRTLLRERLKLSPQERIELFGQFIRQLEELRCAAQRRKSK